MQITPALSVLALAFFGFVTPALASESVALQKAFHQASKEFKVPVQVLQAVSYVETRWTAPEIHDEQDAEHPPVYGVMGLRSDDWFGDSLTQAAKLIGKPASTLKTDTLQNVRGAAALLHKLAKSDSQDPRDWIEAVRAYSGIPGYEESTLYVHQVYQTIRGELPTEGAQLEALPIDLPSFTMDGLAAQPDAALLTEQQPEWDPSVNFTPGAITPQYIVIHDTEGNFAGSASWLKSPRSNASAHFILRSSDGFTKQLVKDTDRAWHARCWNALAIGIEHEGFVNQPKFYTEAMYNSSARLVARLAAKFGIPLDDMHIVGHDFWRTKRYKDSPLSQLGCKNNHSDPGAHWNWMHYFQLIRAN